MIGPLPNRFQSRSMAANASTWREPSRRTLSAMESNWLPGFEGIMNIAGWTFTLAEPKLKSGTTPRIVDGAWIAPAQQAALQLGSAKPGHSKVRPAAAAGLAKPSARAAASLITTGGCEGAASALSAGRAASNSRPANGRTP